jgi:pathogenesis-related protein 1
MDTVLVLVALAFAMCVASAAAFAIQHNQPPPQKQQPPPQKQQEQQPPPPQKQQPPPPPPQQQSPQVPFTGSGVCDPQAALAKHNEYRRKHGREPLVWDERLARSAQKKADGCKFKHEGAMLDGKLVGENLAWATPRNFTCAHAIQGMYVTEAKPRGSDRNLPDGGINHVTQILWPSARKVGCGLARCPKLGNNMACHYDAIQSRRQ